LRDALVRAEPNFHKCTEDGTAYVIFRLGSLEIRAVEEDGERSIGAVFTRASPLGLTSRPGDDEKILKVTEYIESSPCSKLRCQYYVVFQTVMGHSIVTERLVDGQCIWQDVCANLEDRNSLAKVLRSCSCQGQLTVGQLRALCTERSQALPARAAGKRYAHMIYSQVSGEPEVTKPNCSPAAVKTLGLAQHQWLSSKA